MSLDNPRLLLGSRAEGTWSAAEGSKPNELIWMLVVHSKPKYVIPYSKGFQQP